MSSGVVTPSLEAFTELASERRVIPVTRRLMADAETPVGLYRKLAQDADMQGVMRKLRMQQRRPAD